MLNIVIRYFAGAQPERSRARLTERLRARVPAEIPALWAEPPRLRVLTASVVSMFALSIFPPFLTPAAETIQTELKEDPTSLGIIVLLGIALGAGATLLGGAIGDTSGHRRWLLVGLVGLLVSCLIGVVTGVDGLVAMGLLGGFWSGFALPLGIAIVADAYPDRMVQDTGIGLGLAAMVAAQLVAPILQEVSLDIGGTGAIYAVPIVTTCLALLLVMRWVPERVADLDTGRRHVVAQALLAAVPISIAAFVIVLLPGEVDDVAVVGLVMLGAIAGLAAIVRVRRGRPLLPAAAAPARMILVALFVGVFMSFAVTAPLHYFQSFLRVVREWQEIPAIVAIVPHVIPLLLGGIWAPRLAARFGYPRVILASMLVLSVSTASFALASADTRYAWFVLPLAALGLGLIVGATARAGLIMSRMPKALPGFANALNLASMELGGILGSTVMTVMIMRFATDDYAEHLAGTSAAGGQAGAAVDAFRELLRSVAPGGTTVIAPERVEGLLPGFQASLADGISASLWWVAIATLGATVIAAILFRWARAKDELPPEPFEDLL